MMVAGHIGGNFTAVGSLNLNEYICGFFFDGVSLHFEDSAVQKENLRLAKENGSAVAVDTPQTRTRMKTEAR